jgi:hypothetical protein
MRILLSVLLVLILVRDYDGEPQRLLPQGIRVTARPVALYPGDPARRDVGALTYMGGVELKERGRGTGGYSALLTDGERFVLASDGGNVLGFRLTLPDRIEDVATTHLAEGPGMGWTKRDRDVEAIARDPETGTLWAAFENSNAIWRYSPGFVRATGSARPAAMRAWPDNGGAEAMARLRDGRFVVIAEQARVKGRRGVHQAVMFAGDPVEAPDRGWRFGYRPPRGFIPVDMAELPDGDLIVLNRRFSLGGGFTNSIDRIARASIAPGAIVSGRTLARLERPTLHDNFEGLAVVREANATMLWLVSDDNQFFLQRTLLLKFRLGDRPERARGGTGRP